MATANAILDVSPKCLIIIEGVERCCAGWTMAACPTPPPSIYFVLAQTPLFGRSEPLHLDVRAPSGSRKQQLRSGPEHVIYREVNRSTNPMNPEPLLRINLFEPLCVQLGERPPLDEHYARRKAKALFVYLFLNRGRWLSKYELLADLWPGAEDADPGRVKHTVQVLRSSLEGPRPPGGWHVILEQGGSYTFNNAAERYSDIEEYEKEISAARSAKASSDSVLARAHYQRAIDLHRGAFLAEFRYDDWSAVEIARQFELHLDVLEEAARLESSDGNFHRAIELLRLATVEDPLRESSYVELMRNLWIERRRTEALRVYHHLRDILARRLDIEPQPQTIRLYEAIRRDEALAV